MAFLSITFALEICVLVEERDSSLIALCEAFVFLPEGLGVEFLRILQLFLHAVVGDELALVLLQERRQGEAVHPESPHEVDHVQGAVNVLVDFFQGFFVVTEPLRLAAEADSINKRDAVKARRHWDNLKAAGEFLVASLASQFLRVFHVVALPSEQRVVEHVQLGILPLRVEHE